MTGTKGGELKSVANRVKQSELQTKNQERENPAAESL